MAGKSCWASALLPLDDRPETLEPVRGRTADEDMVGDDVLVTPYRGNLTSYMLVGKRHRNTGTGNSRH